MMLTQVSEGKTNNVDPLTSVDVANQTDSTGTTGRRSLEDNMSWKIERFTNVNPNQMVAEGGSRVGREILTALQISITC